MSIYRQIPWRKVKVVALIGILLLVAHSLWASAIGWYQPSVKFTHDVDKDSRFPQAIDEFMFTRPIEAARPVAPEKIKKQDMENVKVHDDRPMDKRPVVIAGEGNTCDKIIPFSDHSDDRISTYDLPAETDYSLAADGRYKIPEEFYKADINPPEENINVILVPFSHTDPGYGRTVEQYYTSMTRNVLNNMVTYLSRTPNMTFQWAETIFLERWFRDIDDATKQKVRELITNGQLEIVLGGWVMPDEAVTHYLPVVDQLIEGHQWLIENLGVTPTDAWVNDPFGFSSTMPYLWKSSGIDNLVILRIHQAVKATLMKKRSLDFMWRPYWNSLRDDDILCNLMPYQNYWNSDVCGPDPNVCRKFNFLHMNFGNGAVPVTDSNVGSLAKELYSAYRFTASMFQYNNIVIFLGEDNSYDNMLSWQDTYNNYQKLASFINSKSDWKMHIKFGTIREYFENIRTAEAHSKHTMKFPVLSGDFFPYSDKEDDYWTGYFTTRPWMKRFTREIEPMIRAADRFSVILYFHCVVRGACSDVKNIHQQILRDLRDARREVGIYQHHDGITGTSLPFVVDDYEQRLFKAFQCTKNALALSVVTIITHGNVKNARVLIDNNVKSTAKDLLGPNVHKFNQGELKIIIANSLEKARVGTVSFYIEKKEIGSVSNVLSYQISETDSSKYQNYLLLTLLVELSPFELKIVEIRTKQTDGTNLSPYIEEIARPKSGSDEIISIENKFMKVEFYTKNGSLKCIVDKRGRSVNISSTFMKYKPKKSGAYLFGPAGPAEAISTLLNPQVKVSTGPVLSRVLFEFKPGFTQKWTLYHTDSVKGRGLHLTQDISLMTDPSFLETELILRLKTDINSGNIFYTDQNGFQLMGRQNNRSTPIERNYYPITSMALIEDIERRLTLHSAQSHGVASLEKGWLEVMLDRNMAHDDQKGLGMGATERIPTLTEFIIQIEYNNEAVEIQEPRYTHASVESNLLNEQLQNKPEAFSIAFEAEKFQEGFHIPEKVAQFPCDTTIVSLRSLVTNDLQINGTSFVLHRKPKHCSFPVNVASCSMTNGPVNFLNFNFGLDSKHLSENVTETSLSHVHSLGRIQVSDDLRPGVNELRSFLIRM